MVWTVELWSGFFGITILTMDEINQPMQGVPQLVPSSFPEEWGGRPVGTSRRQRRMQNEWDKTRERQLKEYQVARQAFESDRAFAMQQRDQYLQEARTMAEQQKAASAQRIEDQKTMEAAEFMKGFSMLDPRSPDFKDKLISLRIQYPLGQLDEGINKIAGDYEGVHNIYRETQKAAQEQQKQQGKDITSLVSDARQLGLTDKDIMVAQKFDPVTKTGVWDVDALRQIVDTTKGKRATEEQQSKRIQDTRTPLEKAQTELAAAQARRDVYINPKTGKPTDPKPYLREVAAVKAAESNVSQLSKKAEAQSPTAGKYIVGKTYGGLIYLGGDINQESSWKKK